MIKFRLRMGKKGGELIISIYGHGSGTRKVICFTEAFLPENRKLFFTDGTGSYSVLLRPVLAGKRYYSE